jgi:hypothetical protein
MAGWLQALLGGKRHEEILVESARLYLVETPAMLKKRGREATRLCGEGIGEVAGLLANRFRISVPAAIEARSVDYRQALAVANDCQKNLDNLRPLLNSGGNAAHWAA